MAGGSSSSLYVCEDLVMDILSRLPVNSLVRFRCVCKSWYALIKSPYFITKHLQRNLIKESSANLLYVRSGYRSVPTTFVSWISSSNNNEAVLLGEEEMPSVKLDSPLFPDRCPILGPVRGIYCVMKDKPSRLLPVDEDMEIMFYLFNPALREFKTLPELPEFQSHVRKVYGPVTIVTEFGFGYDSRHNDFKVVACIDIWPGPKHVFVYSLRCNSWRKIDNNNLPQIAFQHSSIFVSHGNGVIHWLALDDCDYEAINLSFDLGTEVFSYSAMPDSVIYSERTYLVAFNDSMAAIVKPMDRTVVNYPYEKVYCHEVWVMKEYGSAKESWSKLYTIDFIPCIKRPIRFWKNGEILFHKRVENHNFTIVSYNPSCQQIKDLHVLNPIHVLTYMESLVSLNGDY